MIWCIALAALAPKLVDNYALNSKSQEYTDEYTGEYTHEVKV
jgi:hypothetical protein